MSTWLTIEEQEYEDFLNQEEVPPTPVEERFVHHHLVSRTKGRSMGLGRKRRAIPYARPFCKEVDLIADKMESKRPLRYRTEAKFPFDVKATEVYDDPTAGSERLRSDIRKL